MNEYLTRKRSSGDYGKQETLPPSLQTKMNQSFGMDFSSVKLYRNDEMSGTGMQGLASGNRVVLSREVDLNSKLGQAVLGHELSHVHAQSQGIGGGHSGLYDNAALEHQADREGRMAAQGQSVYGASGGMPIFAGMQNMGGLQPLSGGMSASAGAPMQAKKNKNKKHKMGKKAKGNLAANKKKLVDAQPNPASGIRKIINANGEVRYAIANPEPPSNLDMPNPFAVDAQPNPASGIRKITNANGEARYAIANPEPPSNLDMSNPFAEEADVAPDNTIFKDEVRKQIESDDLHFNPEEGGWFDQNDDWANSYSSDYSSEPEDNALAENLGISTNGNTDKEDADRALMYADFMFQLEEEKKSAN